MLLPYSITNQQQHRFQKEDLEQPAPTTMSRIRPFYRQRHQVNNFVIPPCTSINLYLIRPYHHHLDCLFKRLNHDSTEYSDRKHKFCQCMGKQQDLSTPTNHEHFDQVNDFIMLLYTSILIHSNF